MKRCLSVVLALVLLLGCAAWTPVHAKEKNETPGSSEIVTPEKNKESHEDCFYTECEEDGVFRHLDRESFGRADHVARLPEEEALNTYVFQNRDGTRSVYYMGENVKYIAPDGSIRDKDTTLVPVTDGYGMRDNDVELLLPQEVGAGIRMAYKGHSIRLIPQGAAEDAQLQENSVHYREFGGPDVSLQYTPILSGVKEDIVLESYTGVSSFAFVLYTGGLGLYESEGKYFLAETENAEAAFYLGQIIVYDAVGCPSMGAMTVEVLAPGQAYRLTVSANVDFLTAPTTVYPVTIDPTITVTDTMEGGVIEDAPVFSGYPDANFGNYVFNTIGYTDANYGIGRTVVRLNGLLENETFAALDTEYINKVEFFMKDGGSDYTTVNIHAIKQSSSWTESTVTWNYAGIYSLTSSASAAMGGGAWTGFDITDLALAWKSGDQNGQCGFVMIGAEENTKKIGALSCEYGTGDYWPYVVVNYSIDLPLNYYVKDVLAGSSFTLIAYGEDGEVLDDVNWTSSNPSVATVSTSGSVTGIRAGTVTITASNADGYSTPCTVYVRIPDGVYYIKNASSGLVLQNTGTVARIYSQTEDVNDRTRQLWKIRYISNGYYEIRPMDDLSVALMFNNDSYASVFSATDENLAKPLLWKISCNGFGYTLQNMGMASRTLLPTNATTAGTNAYASNWTSSLAGHWKLEKINGLFLRDPDTRYFVPTTTVKNLKLRQTYTLPQLALSYEYYGNLIGGISWSSSDTSVAIVNASGSITAVGLGQATITFYAILNGVNYTASVSVFVHIPNGVYCLMNKQTGYCADFVSATMEDGSAVVQTSYRDANTQKWIFTYLGNGYYSICSDYAYDPYYLGVEGDSREPGAKIVLRTGNITDGMKWEIRATESGAYTLTAKSCNLNRYVLNGNALLAVEYVELTQGNYSWDYNYEDEWLILPIIRFGISSDDYIEGCPHGKLGSTHYAESFFDALALTEGGFQKAKIHYHNTRNSILVASKNNFSVNGAISNDIDFMVYIGHGHAAHDEQGNHLHYDCGILGTPHVYNESLNQYIYCNPEGNVYTSQVKFGGEGSSLRWVWLYTCNFLSTGPYVTDDALKNMMNGAHIVMGYASQSLLCDAMALKFAEYLTAGMPIIEAYFKAGRDGEATITDDHHIQKVLYIPQAEQETIYSQRVYYAYSPDDVRIITQDIQEDFE